MTKKHRIQLSKTICDTLASEQTFKGSSAKVAQQSPISQGKMGASVTFLCYFCGIAFKEFSQALSPQVAKNAEEEIARMLNSAAGKTVEQIREVSFLTIDARSIFSSQAGAIGST